MSLWRALGIVLTMPRVVTLVGAGGKTTLLYALAHEARAAGLPVIVTTTTHMRPHPRLRLTRDPEDVLTHGIIQLGVPCGDGKLVGTGNLTDCRSLAVTLIEGDGSRGLPLKLPAAHEPVIPPESDTVLAVAGLSAVGRPIGEVGHRPELICALLGKSECDPITLDDIHLILAQKKGVLPYMKYIAMLNQGDCFEADGIVTRFREEERGGLCWF